jgi:type I restriction-modification system DNA methylase subunit
MAEAVTAPAARSFSGFSEITSFIWSVADLLRGDYKQADYGKVILPLTVIRRLDCVLRDTKEKVLRRHDALKGGKVKNLDPLLALQSDWGGSPKAEGGVGRRHPGRGCQGGGQGRRG